MLSHRAPFNGNTHAVAVNTRRSARLLALPVALLMTLLLSATGCSDAPDEGIPREPFSERVDP